MSTLWTLSHCALHRRGTAGTSKGSAIGYVKGESAFWAAYNSFWLRTHCDHFLWTRNPM